MIGVLARLFCPKSRGFALSLRPGEGKSRPFKNFPGVSSGGGGGGDGQAWNSLIHYFNRSLV